MLNDITVRFGFTCKETTKEEALASTCCARLSADGSFLLGAGVYRSLVARGAYLRSLAFDASSPKQSAGEQLGVLAKVQTRVSGANSQGWDWSSGSDQKIEDIWTISGTALTMGEIDVKAEVVGPQFGESDTWFSVATVATVGHAVRLAPDIIRGWLCYPHSRHSAFSLLSSLAQARLERLQDHPLFGDVVEAYTRTLESLRASAQKMYIPVGVAMKVEGTNVVFGAPRPRVASVSRVVIAEPIVQRKVRVLDWSEATQPPNDMRNNYTTVTIRGVDIEPFDIGPFAERLHPALRYLPLEAGICTPTQSQIVSDQPWDATALLAAVNGASVDLSAALPGSGASINAVRNAQATISSYTEVDADALQPGVMTVLADNVPYEMPGMHALVIDIGVALFERAEKRLIEA